MFINNMNIKITDVATLLHPPAKLCYALITQCNVGQSAGVQMSYICHLNSMRESLFVQHSGVGWLMLNGRKNNKTVDKWPKVFIYY